MDVKGIITQKDGKVNIKSDLSFLDEEYFKNYIENKDYVKLEDENLWAIKSNDKYIIDDYNGIDKLVNDLKENSLKDPLTGCYNKKETESLLESFLKNFLRYKIPFSILMLDIDFFKKINDTYGHLAGDFVLKEISKIMKNIIRESDICGRFGGEEFIIGLPNTKISGAMKLAKRIKSSIEENEFQYNNTKIQVTVSIGVTSASKNDSIFSLIERADEALYEAKKKGRNRIEYR